MIDTTDLMFKPYQKGGRGPETYDCYGLLRECWRRAHGVELPDFQSHTDRVLNAVLFQDGIRAWRRVEARPGTAVLLRIDGVGSHIGFMLDDFWFIHAWEGGNNCVVKERVALWEKQRQVLGFYEFVGSGGCTIDIV